MKQLNARFWWSLGGGLVTIAVAVIFFLAEERSTFIPAEIGGMKLAQQFSGEAAQGMINRLHGKGVTPQENFIGFYEGNDAQATLYISVYANAAEAEKVEGKMARRIQGGNPIFGSFRKVSVGGQPASECEGMGQIHYFFSRGTKLYWLAADPSVARQTLENLLH